MPFLSLYRILKACALYERCVCLYSTSCSSLFESKKVVPLWTRQAKVLIKEARS